MAEFELKNPKLVRSVLLGVSGVLYVLSLTQLTFCTGSSCSPGFMDLLMGWLEPLGIKEAGPFVAFAWWANPFLLLAWILTAGSSRTLARTFATIALLLGVGFLFGSYVTVDEGGGGSRITGYRDGYWLWLTSLTVTTLAAFIPRAIVRAED